MPALRTEAIGELAGFPVLVCGREAARILVGFWRPAELLGEDRGKCVARQIAFHVAAGGVVGQHVELGIGQPCVELVVGDGRQLPA